MLSLEYLKRVINFQSHDIAFAIGNGINRFKEQGQVSSWNEILFYLWTNVYGDTLKKIPSGISLTEFYDLLELGLEIKNEELNLQKEFCEPLSR